MKKVKKKITIKKNVNYHEMFLTQVYTIKMVLLHFKRSVVVMMKKTSYPQAWEVFFGKKRVNFENITIIFMI